MSKIKDTIEYEEGRRIGMEEFNRLESEYLKDRTQEPGSKLIADIRVPTVTYGYFEIKNFQGTESEIIDKHQELIRLYNEASGEKKGLPLKEWNRALEGYLEVNSMPVEVYEAMNNTQKMIIQEIKRCVKRLRAKEERE